MKNIHLIPTDKPSRLIIYSTLLNEFRLLDAPIDGWKHKRNIYITSDEEIKEGYYLDLTHNIVMKSVFYPSSDKNCKKIILTTDQDLIKNGVQAIDDDFLEWFVKNPSCEFVDVNDWMDINGNIAFGGNIRYQISCSTYKEIILPQEEPKQDYSGVHFRHCYQGEYEDGCKYGKDDCPAKPKEEPKQENCCTPIGQIKRYMDCIGCDRKPTQENNFFESLQKYFKETPREKVLEDWNKSAHLDNVGPTVEEFVENSNEERFKEAAELYLENVNTKVHKDLERDGWMKIGFISGAKSDAARDYWFEKFQEQDKNKYSDEDLREAFRQGHKSARTGSYNDITEQEDYNKWFSQFKKNEQ
jgi:hypothetical protein